MVGGVCCSFGWMLELVEDLGNGDESLHLLAHIEDFDRQTLEYVLSWVSAGLSCTSCFPCFRTSLIQAVDYRGDIVKIARKGRRLCNEDQYRHLKLGELNLLCRFANEGLVLHCF